MVLAILAGTESAERHIFHQDMSFGPKGPYASQKLLVIIGIDTFQVKTGHQLHRSARSATESAHIASFRLFAVAEGLCNHFTAYIEIHVFAIAEFLSNING